MGSSFLGGIVAGSSVVLGGLFALRFPIGRRTFGVRAGLSAGALMAAISFDLVVEADDVLER
jgi:zinc transporter, ZIP family